MEEDFGIFALNKCENGAQGFWVYKDFLKVDTADPKLLEEIHFNESIKPTALAINKNSFKEDIPELPETKHQHENLGMLLGTQDGQLIIIDPILRGKLTYLKYTTGTEKKKAVEIVRWLEKGPSRPHSSRFLVVFNDGMIGFYHKDRDVPAQTQTTDKHGNVQATPYDADKDMLRLGEQNVSKLTIMKKMRGFVEEYNFDEFYHKKT